MEVKAYTAITGGYDEPREDIICFGDEHYERFKRPRLNAKIFKVLSHRYIDADISIWVDGNIYLEEDKEKIAKEFLEGGYDIATWKHFARNCVYDEAHVAKTRIKPKYWANLNEQVRQYHKEGYPQDNGLAECNVIVRKHNDRVREFNVRWWAEICRYSARDQISFPYIEWVMGNRIKIKKIEANVRRHPYFSYQLHEKTPNEI